jgi:hypothetical protein
MVDFDEAQYVAAIPKCCSRQTLEEHMNMLLCWGLAASIRAGHKMDCSGCDLKNPDIPVERDAQQHRAAP